MRFFDLVKYAATSTGLNTFSVTVAEGFEELPDSVKSVVTIRDGAGVSATVTGQVVSGTFTRDQLLRSSTGRMPSFGSGITIVSSLGATLIDRGYGMGGLGSLGQSNMLGADSGYDALIDFNHGSVTQFRFDADDNTGTPYTPDNVFIAQDPLFWAEQTTVSNTVSPAPHMAKALRTYAGHEHIQILPGAQNSTAFGEITSGPGVPGEQWIKTGVLYERAKDMHIEFLDRNDANYMAAVVMMLGESDALEGMSEATFSAFLDAFWIDFKADILAGTTNNYDMSTTPFIVVGMNDAFLAFESNGVNIQNSLIDTPNRIQYSAYISMVGQTAADVFHHTTVSQRNLGRDLFIPNGYFPALANSEAGITTATVNTPFEGLTNAIIATVTGDINATINTPFEGLTNAITAAVTGVVNADIATPFEGITNAMTGTVTSSIALDMLLQKGVGETLNGSDISTWADQSGNGNDAVQTNASLQPESVAGGASFSIAEYLDLPVGLAEDTTNGMTIIIDLTCSAGGQVIMGSDNTFISTNELYRGMNNAGANDINGVIEIDDSTRHQIALAIDIPGDIARASVDGTADGTNVGLTIAGTAGTLKLGASSGGSFGLAGIIHNIAIAKRNLTDPEIATVIADNFIT